MEKGDFEMYKRTEQWVAVADNKQIWSLTKLLSQERELYNEACACYNDKIYRLRQEIESARKDLQAKDVALSEVNRRLIEAEGWAYAKSPRTTRVEEDRQQVLTQHAEAVAQDDDDAKIVNVILDAPEVSVAIKVVRAKARDGGKRVGYIECLTQVNAVSERKFTDEQCPVREVDTEGKLKAASEAYDNLVVPTIAQVEECFSADDYVDRLPGLFQPKEKGKPKAKIKGDLGLHALYIFLTCLVFLYVTKISCPLHFQPVRKCDE
ncbi:hypothetical protein HanHA300_Chr14g0518001 [Helianthus annuus]|nr:hypothetical protein HanHA300_Chr14g0518001 [Helianthus annuus]KAJ0467820.1 hypothetical protein HanIR_Chr14g0689531 [Helianthus annuus]